MKVRLGEEEVRKRINGMCDLDSTFGMILVGKEFDMRFLILTDSRSPVKNNVGGDLIEK